MIDSINKVLGGLRKYKSWHVFSHDMTELQDEILKHSKDGSINCAMALGIAKKLKIPPAKVGATIDELGMKIHNCQLGCFK